MPLDSDILRVLQQFTAPERALWVKRFGEPFPVSGPAPQVAWATIAESPAAKGRDQPPPERQKRTGGRRAGSNVCPRCRKRPREKACGSYCRVCRNEINRAWKRRRSGRVNVSSFAA